MSITLTNLIAEARRRSDAESTQHVTDSEITNYLNSSIAELHDLLIGATDSEYRLTSTTFSTVAGTDSYALASDFYKLKGVDYQTSSTTYSSVRPFNFNERNRQKTLTYWLEQPDIRYRLVGNNLTFTPVPDSVRTIRYWYVPVATKLVSGSDTLDDINQFSEYVVVDTAIKILAKEESDVSVLMAQKAELKRRIEVMAQNRDEGQPASISDIYAEKIDWIR